MYISSSCTKSWYYSVTIFVTVVLLLPMLLLMTFWTSSIKDYNVPVRSEFHHPLSLTLPVLGSESNTSQSPVSTSATHSTFSTDLYQWDFRSQPILPRCAFFGAKHPETKRQCKNVTVILVVILKTALRDHVVTGCESEGYRTKNVKVNSFIQNGWAHHRRSYLTHDEAIATCCNLPVKNGSTTFILYKDKMGHEKKVKTERDLYIPSEQPHKPKPSIVVCVTVYGKPPWLRQWLLYQKVIGVDHIYLYAQQSFINEGSANDTILQQYLDTNYATLDVWPAYLNTSQVLYRQQILLYNDCIYRHRNTFDYALLYDTDDFFVPVVPGETDIHYYVQKLFTDHSRIGSISFVWPLYHADCGLTQDPSTIKDGNITQYLVHKKEDSRFEYVKSIHKISAVNEIGIHEALNFARSYRSQRVPRSLAYIAHIRPNTLKKHPNACKG